MIEIEPHRKQERALLIASTAVRLHASLDTLNGPMSRVAYFEAGGDTAVRPRFASPSTDVVWPFRAPLNRARFAGA